jgi:hypothetical protein
MLGRKAPRTDGFGWIFSAQITARKLLPVRAGTNFAAEDNNSWLRGSEDFVRQGMPDVFSKTDKMAVCFACLDNTLAARCMMLIVNPLIESEIGNHTDVGQLGMESEVGSVIVDCGGRHSIEYESAVMTTECPTLWGGIRGVHDTMNKLLKLLPVTFGVILVLVVWFALPILNDEGTKYVLDTVADLNGGTVTDKFIHGSSPLADFVFKGVDECA